MKRIDFYVALILIIAVVLAFIYPSLYWHTTIKMNNYEFPVKVNRITDESWYLTNTGWREMKE
jgi:hypothetical protein